MRTCPNCHLEYDDKFSFCKRCGQRLERSQIQDSCVTPNTDVQNTNNHKSNSWILIAGVVVLVALLGFFVTGDNGVSGNPTNKVSSSIAKKPLVPNHFVSVDVQGHNIFLPRNYIRIKEEEKMFDSPSIGRVERAGVGLYGLVDNNNAGENDMLKRYEVIVSYSQSPSFRNIKPHIEEKAFEEGYNGTMTTVRQSANVKLISKEICKNADGHRYLKVVYVVSERGNLDNKLLIHYAITYYDGIMYGIFLRTAPETNGKFDKDFDIILNTFGTTQ